MYLNIPTKLEIYFNQIKEHTKYIHAKDNFTLIKLGETNKSDSIKLMYMIYNPFPTSVKIDCNSFTQDSKIYKMYPTEFVLNSDTVCAFVCFVSEGNQIQFDERNFLSNMRQTIVSKLIKLNDLEITEFNKNNFIKIEPQSIEVDQTVLLNGHLELVKENSNELKYKEFSSKYDNLVEVSFKNYEIDEENINFIVEFSNKDKELNFLIQSFRLKIYDNNAKVIIDVKSSFKLKASSLKTITLKTPLDKIKMIDLEKLKLKITIL